MATEPKDYTQDEDVRLMLAVKAGDAAAFEQLVSRHQERILSTLIHFTDSLQQAEELTQEVFLKVYEARLRYEPTAKFTTWLYRIVRNEGLNAVRHKKRHPERYLNASSPADEDGANA
ncbi:MAG: sigma-70 family RNA polymerase sigma factor, partial [Thermoguttaceae bacterium]|nr:sigma-70 family RNA polymerase sigma factor [Thermoguttaceae bacterium]